jgi:hypothetical protein
VRAIFLACLVVIVAGLVVVVLPDADERVITFSGNHGPSFVDIVGLILIVIPWFYMTFHAVKHWPVLLQLFGRKLVSVLLAVALGGFMVLVISIRSDSELWWMGAVLSAAAQFALIVPSFREPRRRN